MNQWCELNFRLGRTKQMSIRKSKYNSVAVDFQTLMLIPFAPQYHNHIYEGLFSLCLNTWIKYTLYSWAKLCNEYTSAWAGFELMTLVVIGTDCTGSCKSNYHTIKTTTAPEILAFLDNHICLIAITVSCIYQYVPCLAKRGHFIESLFRFFFCAGFIFSDNLNYHCHTFWHKYM